MTLSKKEKRLFDEINKFEVDFCELVYNLVRKKPGIRITELRNLIQNEVDTSFSGTYLFPILKVLKRSNQITTTIGFVYPLFPDRPYSRILIAPQDQDPPRVIPPIDLTSTEGTKIVDQISKTRSRRKNGEGTIVERYQRCGKPNCRCMTEGNKHGPYRYLVTTINGKRKWVRIHDEDPKESIDSLGD